MRIAASVFGTGRVETVKEIVEDVGSRIVSVWEGGELKNMAIVKS